MQAEEYDRVRVETKGTVYEGTLMPSQTGSIVLKLKNGYNVGISRDSASVTLIEKKEDVKKKETTSVCQKTNKKLPNISILSTGGTIASKIDYRTGGVTSQFTAEDIMGAIPELGDIANYNCRMIYSILSENMRPSYWSELARAVHEEITNGADGVIITHGTDTMMYTAAALSFMIETPVPIVLVGSQRSADRPSSDNAMNAICAAAVATSELAEVCVVMHGSTSDDFCSIHRGTKVRKMHTSRRDAFQSINARPIGRVEYPSRKIKFMSDYTKRGEKKLSINDRLEPKCAIIKYTTGASSESLLFHSGSGYRGIVIEGTGLGHVSTEWIPNIKNATDAGIPVIMTSQCINGRVCDRVYDTGRDILGAGAIEGEDMLPEVALVKLMWALGQTSDMDKIKEIMRKDIAGEITRSTCL
ncbi:MAG: Glu-tRNA(Gln) amidotransferase subunit GatD [Candidatus Methanoperedens sp.]|jgi:glutamyl-tRNA(Gln) amidotransferase subunit D|nr:Glu-tRNA(Gln) amidotransferase subunit GatD [Candidatus Methanoperedens sp.]PKL53408.1 MAG: Glu-tRNA(Gln) amidotransferase GatDE subunit D [Candidatus Methanoperedenaceae archaeon HGW-Methanoperedenaceae-1]